MSYARLNNFITKMKKNSITKKNVIVLIDIDIIVNMSLGYFWSELLFFQNRRYNKKKVSRNNIYYLFI